jgi:hypothetical protein
MVRSARKFGQRLHLAHDAEICRFARDGVVLVDGHFFYAFESVRKHGNLVRQFLQPANPYRVEVERHISRLRSQYETLVGVHIRSGDYRQFDSGRWYFKADVYLAYLQMVYEQLADRNPVFVLCSDEMLNTDDFRGVPHAMGPGTAVTDLYVLAHCDWLISTRSSFAAWASFYGLVPRYVICNPTARITLADFWICDDLRGNISKGGEPFEYSGCF